MLRVAGCRICQQPTCKRTRLTVTVIRGLDAFRRLPPRVSRCCEKSAGALSEMKTVRSEPSSNSADLALASFQRDLLGEHGVSDRQSAAGVSIASRRSSAPIARPHSGRWALRTGVDDRIHGASNIGYGLVRREA